MTVEGDGPNTVSGLRCTECGELRQDESLMRCPVCWNDSLVQVRFPACGAVHTYTTMIRPMPGFDPPYMVALVDLDCGIRVMGTVETSSPSTVRGGTRVIGVEREAGNRSVAITFRIDESEVRA